MNRLLLAAVLAMPAAALTVEPALAARSTTQASDTQAGDQNGRTEARGKKSGQKKMGKKKKRAAIPA
jgi:hypothetical protein